jgi:flagellar hook protein FlgE
MMSGMYAAISGLEANQTMLNVMANNLANVNTAGYKASTVDFADSLTQVMRGASGANGSTGGTNPVQVGLGVQVAATQNEMGEGALETTSDPLDIAIEGKGFLRVGVGTPEAGEGGAYTKGLPTTVDYTRAGDLTTNANGFLTTQAGQYVVGFAATATTTEAGTTYAASKEESYIRVPPGSTDVSIGPDGAVSYVDEEKESPQYGERVTAGYISLASFANEAGLERLGGSLWGATANSGTPLVGTPSGEGFGTTIGGELEMSNVNLAGEMTAMITAERGYQANSRVITTADEMLQSAVSMVQ